MCTVVSGGGGGCDSDMSELSVAADESGRTNLNDTHTPHLQLIKQICHITCGRHGNDALMFVLLDWTCDCAGEVGLNFFCMKSMFIILSDLLPVTVQSNSF